jgi:hypothetical protein
MYVSEITMYTKPQEEEETREAALNFIGKLINQTVSGINSLRSYICISHFDQAIHRIEHGMVTCLLEHASRILYNISFEDPTCVIVATLQLARVSMPVYYM